MVAPGQILLPAGRPTGELQAGGELPATATQTVLFGFQKPRIEPSHDLTRLDPIAFLDGDADEAVRTLKGELGTAGRFQPAGELLGSDIPTLEGEALGGDR
jgi:hypothetical protein